MGSSFLLVQHCTQVNNNMSKIQGKLFVHSCCYLWPHGWEGRNKCVVRGGRYAARNSTRIVNGSIRKLSWRGLSCKKLKMGNICPRDKFFTQYLVCPLRDIPFNLRAILLTEIVNLNTFSWASCRFHSRKSRRSKTFVKRENYCLAWGTFLGFYFLDLKYA